MQPKPLNGKVAIVTGAGSPIGMGRAMTFALVQAGARVAMLDINEEWLEQSAGEVRAAGGDDCVLDLVCDVSDPESVEDAVRKTIAGLGGLHVLVNNAGTMNLADLAGGNLPKFWHITPETWSRIIAVNSSGSFFMARAAVGHMLDQGWGRIIGVTTSVDTMYRPGFCPYGPSKASHEALVALMSRELDGTGVTANVLIPGGQTDTHMIPDDIAVGREILMRPEVMNGPAVWLASEESDRINGMRLIAHYWDESLPLEQRLDQAAAPAAWPQLGKQGIFPGYDL
ncbi:MAG: SDR family NAD(P)-dependent oxidoreductase [Acidimicrobiia bacterium]|nr:SDR family NAD(P)-dependent oxidoreductase [Acidimicrobiia bacterium]